jgi:probable rRNA maturation factor
MSVPDLIVNSQKKVKLDLAAYRKFLTSIKTEISEIQSRSVSVAFISDRRMKELNKFFRGKSTTTDVLSFPFEPDQFDPDNNDLGDIVISVEQAQTQAEENGLTLDGEIRQLILHGVLHLCGFDHETDNGEMNAREIELRDLLDI